MRLALPGDQVDVLAPRIQSVVPDATWVTVDSDGLLAGDGAGVEVWLLASLKPVTAQVLDRLPDLRWIHLPSAGAERVITPELAKRGVVLTNSAGAYARAIAESVLAVILAVVKHLPEHVRNQEHAIWRTYWKRELPGLTLGVLGLGGIGQATARLAHALGMRTLGTVRHPRDIPGVDEVFDSGQAGRVAESSDFLLVSAPSTPETHHLVGESMLRSMKPSAWLINVARGSLVDEEALLRGLTEGWIAGACLDVFEKEPLPPEHPLWHLPNVLITPHNSDHTDESLERWREIFLANLARFVNGQQLLNQVDLTEGY